jgi:hypothetical protein
MSAEHVTTARQYIHYNPDRVDYSVTGEELARLESAGANLWKDACLVCTPVGLSCLINAVASTGTPFVLSVGLFLNYLFGVLGVALAVVFGIAWYQSHQRFKGVIEAIQKKPKMQISVPATVDVGSLPTAALSPTTGGSDQEAG